MIALSIIAVILLGLILVGLVITMILSFMKEPDHRNEPRISKPSHSPSYAPRYSTTINSGSDNIQNYGINEIRSSGNFTPTERATEYRRRRKSPSGVIDGVYNDFYRGNGSYNDSYRDWDANA